MTLAARNANEDIAGPIGGVWRSLRVAGIWSQAVGFVVVRLACHREDVFIFY